MGYIKRWDADDIVRQLRQCSAQLHSSYNDGFTQWDCKKDLLTVKYELEKMLRTAPKFGDVEDSWVAEMEKQRTWEILKDEKTNR